MLKTVDLDSRDNNKEWCHKMTFPQLTHINGMEAQKVNTAKYPREHTA